MTYQININGHADTKEDEEKVAEAARSATATAMEAGTVYDANMSGSYVGSVSLMPEVTAEADLPGIHG